LLATDPALQTRLGGAGRQRVERHFDWNQKVERMLGIYAAALSHSLRDLGECLHDL
jgi:glycosyltransferase involved in cell wall biosynthesis